MRKPITILRVEVSESDAVPARRWWEAAIVDQQLRPDGVSGEAP